jgi:hypothetical protein
MQAWERDRAGTGAAATGDGLFRSAVSTLQAKSLAIVGASERARWPSDIFKNLREFGYPGSVVLVNPRQRRRSPACSPTRKKPASSPPPSTPL